MALFHATEHLLPKLTRARSVFTLHDTAYLLFPEYHLPRNRIYLRTMMPRFLAPSGPSHRGLGEHARRRAALLSSGSGEDRGHPGGRRASLPTGRRSRRRRLGVRDRYTLPERFILSVGTIEPRKNHATLVEAYASLRARHPEVGLVIAGGKGWLYERFFERVRRSDSMIASCSRAMSPTRTCPPC